VNLPPAGPRAARTGQVGPRLYVIMHGREVAVLSSPRAQTIGLTYTDDAIAVTRGLSCSLPAVGGHYTGARVDNWISGLLPDRSEVLTRWRAMYGVKRQDAYALLWHVGEDVAGAARFVRPDRLDAAVGAPAATRLADAEIGARIGRLAADAAAWSPSPGTGQFSLAGAQAKFALARRDDGAWIDPASDTPTTHIFKPAIPNMPDQDLNELLTMRLAAAVGLPVARTELTAFDGQRALVVTRFDRYRSAEGAWHRVHQEDAVQALGLPPALKYEEHRGPGVRDIVSLLRQNVTGGNRDRDIETFVDAVAFNWLVVGTDAHARNYSLMHHGTSTRLAPLYDLNSFLPYAREGGRASLSMRIGFNEFDPARVAGRDWDEFARDCHLDPTQVLARVTEMAERILDTVSRVVAAAAAPWESPLPQRFRREVLRHVRDCQRRL
jgi:serine/threonine-protein kinase HipA